VLEVYLRSTSNTPQTTLISFQILNRILQEFLLFLFKCNETSESSFYYSYCISILRKIRKVHEKIKNNHCVLEVCWRSTSSTLQTHFDIFKLLNRVFDQIFFFTLFLFKYKENSRSVRCVWVLPEAHLRYTLI